jgi:hypothetical protein
MVITVDDSRDELGRMRIAATVELDLTLDHEADAVRRVPLLLVGLSDRLLALWQLDDLADAAEYHRDDDR